MTKETLAPDGNATADVKTAMLTLAMRGRAAADQMRMLSTEKKREALTRMADALQDERDAIAQANAEDVAAGKASGLSSSLLDRLCITDARFSSMVGGLRFVAELDDPVGERIDGFRHDNGMSICRQRVPIGLIVIIYESRPNVTADAAALCFMSGNAVILRGGKEAAASNAAIGAALHRGLASSDVNADAILRVETIDRAAVRELLQLNGIVDLAIPRGGERLIRAVSEVTRVPVIKHYKGVCHTYVDASADLQMATRIVLNAKVQRPGVCNAMETLLVHRDVGASFLPAIAAALHAEGVTLRGCAETCAFLPAIERASQSDWETEYLALTLAVRLVDGVEQAVEHIARFGSQHSDAIVASDEQTCEAFLRAVDSAAVYVNASTRFTDGSEFGMGAEIGISTDRLHARGPMGLRELTTYKYVIRGSGQIRR